MINYVQAKKELKMIEIIKMKGRPEGYKRVIGNYAI